MTLFKNNLILAVLNLLEPYQDKLYMIADGERTGLQPLIPGTRNKWILEKHIIAK